MDSGKVAQQLSKHRIWLDTVGFSSCVLYHTLDKLVLKEGKRVAREHHQPHPLSINFHHSFSFDFLSRLTPAVESW